MQRTVIIMSSSVTAGLWALILFPSQHDPTVTVKNLKDPVVGDMQQTSCDTCWCFVN